MNGLKLSSVFVVEGHKLRVAIDYSWLGDALDDRDEFFELRPCKISPSSWSLEIISGKRTWPTRTTISNSGAAILSSI